MYFLIIDSYCIFKSSGIGCLPLDNSTIFFSNSTKSSCTASLEASNTLVVFNKSLFSLVRFVRPSKALNLRVFLTSSGKLSFISFNLLCFIANFLSSIYLSFTLCENCSEVKTSLLSLTSLITSSVYSLRALSGLISRSFMFDSCISAKEPRVCNTAVVASAAISLVFCHQPPPLASSLNSASILAFSSSDTSRAWFILGVIPFINLLDSNLSPSILAVFILCNSCFSAGVNTFLDSSILCLLTTGFSCSLVLLTI